MERIRKINLGRFNQDRGFWIFVLVILVALFVLQADSILIPILTLVALVIAISVHECSHAGAALRLGDNTAARAGRLTLNPLAHLDPLGSMMMLITTLTGMGIGWGKPVPVATNRLRYGPRVGNGIVSVAGPAANFMAAIVFAAAVRALALWAGAPAVALLALSYVVLVNLVIAFFNLLPLPPLDGFGVLIALLALVRADWAHSLVTSLENLSRYGWMILLGVIVLSQFTGLGLLDRVVGQPAYALFALLTGL